ncbi:hypothetical protein ACWEQL_19960 [Kitasatospora sp. NPDC004240]
MPLPLALPCPLCGRPAEAPWSASPPPVWAALTGTARVDWYAPGAHPVLAELPPAVGEVHTVRITGPFHADGPFHALFTPAAAALDGPEDHPETLADLALATCEPLELLDAAGTGTAATGTALLDVRVTALERAAEAAERHPARTAGPLDDLLPPARARTSTTVHGDLRHYAWSVEGDLGRWALARRGPGRDALLLHGTWDLDRDDTALGHRPLTPEECALLDAHWPA